MMPGMPGGPRMPSPGGPGYPKGPMGPGPTPGGSNPTPIKGLKVKPRFEFVLIFTWKEPTPSEKLRQIKEKEPGAATGGIGGPPMGMGLGPKTAGF